MRAIQTCITAVDKENKYKESNEIQRRSKKDPISIG
jgi:hypothetical protein